MSLLTNAGFAASRTYAESGKDYMQAEFAQVLRAELQTEWDFGYSNAAAEITHRYLSRPDTDESVKQYEDEMAAARREWKWTYA